ncbi:glutathione S-transferase C-terminal-like protein [Dichomitus squalens]|uniref:glutathione transferase n=2 Tax=Dichomitus squalens TaxID=114155 RepID=A0A4Q9Q323_9APHY|nr:glutathione S-transferase C-terminal-like protein [Dichomitus squalens LYAD-421 SS1]EJF60628.1 glutathione S-transferase C-terminal-like protein [Dichomitus squalens LYAD-421 SS1]TBU41149.1 glutathione S-transferase C-terminal-like protein [Dichomitus squalens]TBU61545.1 glutathione S-transferase C-terminal-like protein [Dichomitus squalens]
MSHGKQFTLYTHLGGPNGWKVAIVLEELGLTYEPVYLDFTKGEQKGPEHTKYNPNGRIPTLIDHQNGDFAIWESDAILLYLTDKYDTEKKLTVTGDKEKYTLIQWLFFQSSGQGPYFGQAFWFLKFHSEQLPSAIERYRKETLRVFSVLDSVLSKPENGGWLVGGKPTIADLSFITWNNGALNFSIKGYADVEKDYPAFYAWHQKLLARDAVKKTLAIQASLQK